MEQQGIINSGGGGRKKNQGSISMRGGGGGIAGLLVFGGALAVTGLIAVASFASKRNKGKGRPHEDKSPVSGTLPQESDDTNQGLPSLQDSTANDDIDNTRFESSNTSVDHIDSYEIIPTQTLVLEETLDLKVKTNEEEESATSLHQEIVCDDSSPESAASSNEDGVGEECLASSCDGPSFKAEEKVENIGSQESLKSLLVNEGQYENATTEAEETEDDVVGNNDEEEEVAFETSENNSSEETGRTSLDSNEAAIWPAEMIEEPQQEVKRGMVNVQSESEGTAKKIVSDSCVGNDSDRGSFEVSEYAGKTMTSEARAYEKSNLYMALNHQLSVSRSSKSRSWIISMLLLAFLLLLLLLTHHLLASLYVLDVDGGDSVISP